MKTLQYLLFYINTLLKLIGRYVCRVNKVEWGDMHTSNVLKPAVLYSVIFCLIPSVFYSRCPRDYYLSSSD